MGISDKRRVTIDAHLLDAIDQASDNRSAVVEAALRLWQATQQSAIASWPEDTLLSP